MAAGVATEVAMAADAAGVDAADVAGAVAERSRRPFVRGSIVAVQILATVAIAGQASAQPVDCKQFLTGRWAGKGTVKQFNVEVDNAYRYDADGSFETVNRFLGTDGKWQEQRVRGSWTAGAGTEPNSCTLSQVGKFEAQGTSSTTSFTIIDADTFRSFGFDMKRVK